MKIAIIIPRLEKLGPVLVMQYLVNSLAGYKELEIRVFYLDKKADKSVTMNVPVHRYDSSKFRFEEFDVIHTNGIRPDLIAHLHRRKIKCHISTIHNFVFSDLRYSYNWIISRIFGNLWLLLWSKADKLVCVSGSLKSYYEKWLPDEKLRSIYNGIPEMDSMKTPDNDVMSEISGFRKNGLKVIGTVSILTKGKGLDQCFKLLKTESNLSLVIIGNGKEKDSLIRLARKFKVEERVYFSGFRDNPSSYLKYFDLSLIPSRTEGFGLSLVEAVQQKVPIICSDIEVFHELFNENEVTFFRLDDTKSLIAALKIAEQSGKEKPELAYKRYVNNYTEEIMGKAYFKLYQSVSPHPPSALSPVH